jgi:hypothetical protein
LIIIYHLIAGYGRGFPGQRRLNQRADGRQNQDARPPPAFQRQDRQPDEPDSGVDVPDDRVDILSGMFKPKKTIYAKVTYADITGLDGSAAKAGISGMVLNQLTQMDGFIHVVRCFEDESIPHPSGGVDPARDIAAMDGEFILNDLIAVERKLERLAEERKKGAGRDKTVIEREVELFNRFNEGNPPARPGHQRRRRKNPGRFWFPQPQTHPAVA